MWKFTAKVWPFLSSKYTDSLSMKELVLGRIPLGLRVHISKDEKSKSVQKAFCLLPYTLGKSLMFIGQKSLNHFNH